MYEPADCTDICSSRLKCAGRQSSRRTVLGDDGVCSSCKAHEALAALERLCPDEGTPLDAMWEALSASPDSLAATIEKLWDARACDSQAVAS
jgi:hypothetical protein